VRAGQMEATRPWLRSTPADTGGNKKQEVV
jgi:hypothetical protein